MISKNRIAILAIQETHLDKNLLHNVKECFRIKLTVMNSQLEENPCTSVGIVFVINKMLLNPKEVSTHELIKGRALVIKLKWHKNDKIVLLNVYAPNNRSEHQQF